MFSRRKSKRTSVVVFITEDGKVVLQRRSQDAPNSAGRLGLFGGHIEGKESARQALKREIQEETSLKPTMRPKKIAEQHWYKLNIKDASFKVYEGDGAETFTIQEALSRNDLTYSARYALERLLKDDS
jgi:8-oxo-dGTP pyrophosphatase MutT (NUDIX family)